MGRKVKVRDVVIGKGAPLVLIVGPSVIESEGLLYTVAERLMEIEKRLGIPIIFKASYDNAGRTSVKSFRGPGLLMGLELLQKVKERFGLPLLSDVHKEGEVELAAQVLDMLEVPAFLSKQTDLLWAVGESGKPVSIKKGQLLSPWDMAYVIEKVAVTGNRQIVLIERGTCFGYKNVVVDFRSFPVMSSLDCPIAFDATHSVQLPEGDGRSFGQREFVEPLAKAAVAVGCDALYLETHPQPGRALSDTPNMVPLDDLEPMLKVILKLAKVIRGE